MPRFDGTGPAGEGTMSGRGRGVCATDEPQVVERFERAGLPGRGLGLGWFGRAARFGGRGRGAGAGMGRGRGMGRGMGRGWRR